MDNSEKKRSIIKEYLKYKTEIEYGFIVNKYLELYKINFLSREMKEKIDDCMKNLNDSEKQDFLQDIETINKLNDYLSEDYKKKIIQMKEELKKY
jgi:ABC-type phosphate/phosphonate transport system substrate-binding protein